jgi:N-acetylmuramoyl-L-alanine amidase
MDIKQDFIPVNKYSRPGIIRSETLGAIVHWVANPGSTPKENRDYFAGLAETGIEVRFASTQYIIGIDGAVLQTMPEAEVAYHCGADEYTDEAKDAFGFYCALPLSPNLCTVGVELCHSDWTGEFTDRTLESAVELFADICYRHNVPTSYLMRHYDITEKNCPNYFVDHPNEFYDFRIEVAKSIRFKSAYFERYRGWRV